MAERERRRGKLKHVSPEGLRRVLNRTGNPEGAAAHFNVHINSIHRLMRRYHIRRVETARYVIEKPESEPEAAHA